MKRLFFAGLAVVALAISAPTTASADHCGYGYGGYGGAYGYSSYYPSYGYSRYRYRVRGYSPYGYGNYGRGFGIYLNTGRRGFIGRGRRHHHHHHRRHHH